MPKLRFVCAMHDKDLAFDGTIPPMTIERLSDLNPDIPFGSREDCTTGYYLFDFSDAYCIQGEAVEDMDCNQFWQTVLYL